MKSLFWLLYILNLSIGVAAMAFTLFLLSGGFIIKGALMLVVTIGIVLALDYLNRNARDH